MNIDDDEDASCNDGGQKHKYVTAQARNRCHVSTNSYRIANSCNRVQTKSK